MHQAKKAYKAYRLYPMKARTKKCVFDMHINHQVYWDMPGYEYMCSFQDCNSVFTIVCDIHVFAHTKIIAYDNTIIVKQRFI